MSFADELRSQEKTDAERNLDRDKKLLSYVIKAIRDACYDANRFGVHKVSGMYSGYWDMPGGSINKKTKQEVPSRCSGDGYECCAVNDPHFFEEMLKQEISALGFEPQKCELISIPEYKEIGKTFWGMPKYECTGRNFYAIWIDISW